MSDKQNTARPDDLLSRLYWAGKLSGTLPRTTLLPDKAAAQREARAIRRLAFDLPGDVSERVLKLSKSSHLSVYLVLVSAVTALLNRYVDDKDIIVGSPPYDPEAGGDSQADPVPIRVEVGEGATFKTHLVEVKRTVLEAYSHQAYRFDDLIESPAGAHAEDRPPLFDVIVSLGNIHDEGYLSRMKNNISLSFIARAGGISGEIYYNSLLYDEGTPGRVAAHLVNLLGSVLENPDGKLSEARLLSEDEERRLLFEFNDSATDVPVDRTVVELFEEQVRKSPGRIAAVFGDRLISYDELNRRANRLAHNLQASGVGPEVLVAVLARRSIDFLTTLLGIFKAGGAYLPLDPMHPPRRMHQVLGQSKARLVLAAGEFLPVIEQALEPFGEEDRPAVEILEGMLGRGGPEDNPRAAWEPNSLSYVIYTSGSTGMPKGAMIEHAGMRNHLYAKVYDLGINEYDAVGQNAPQCFDVSIWQFLSALLVGGRVHIADDEIARDIPRLLAMLDREAITVLEIVPSQMRSMLEVIESAGDARPELSALRWLMVNGEVLPPELCRRWLALYPRASLINAYGHTECSDDETHYSLCKPPSKELAAVPIGRPLANMRLYVLDRAMSPVPIGVPGEVYVAGVGVGRGYLNDPARTAQVYVPDHFSGEPGARLYKTGDLARFLADGNLEFINRVDFQVKVRGFRIELGEIESVLGQHPGLRESVVIVREDEPDQARVVAYVVARREPAPNTGELHAFLKERLPEYMVPSAFVLLDRIPLNQNGKVDRRALPVPDHLRPGLAEGFVAPRTPVEETIADIWSRLLGIEQVGVRDNFFELGGHSLLATQVMSRVREAFQVELPLQKLFESPTVEGLSLAVTQVQLDEMNEEEITRMMEELNAMPGERLEPSLS